MDIWLKVFTWSDGHCIQSGNYLEKKADGLVIRLQWRQTDCEANI